MNHFKNKDQSINTIIFKTEKRGVEYAIKEALKKIIKNKHNKSIPIIISVSDVFNINQVLKIRDIPAETSNTLIIFIASKQINTLLDLIRVNNELNQRNNTAEFYFKVHSMLLELANNSVKRESANTAKDSRKPVIHITSQSYWISDPNGACYYKGKYHLFFQHNPYREKWGNIAWGHVTGDDLVFWEHMPIALTPQPEIDEGGVFSGCCVINDKNAPIIIYTGIKKENITYHDVELKEQYQFCAACMDDKLEIWKKSPLPLILPPDDINEALVDCFRDPFVWKEGNDWYMLLGTGVKNKGGNALLYKSSDLMRWSQIGFLCDNFEGRNWECCNLFKLKNKYVLIISPEYNSGKGYTTQKEHKYTLYSIGDFDTEKGKFKPDNKGWEILDLGGSNAFCAPHTFTDRDSNRIMWGWINTDNKGEFKWNGVISLPRILELNDRDELMVKPFPALSKLRMTENPLPEVKVVLKSDSENVLDFLQGSVLEVVINIDEHKNLKKIIFSIISDIIYEIEYDHSEKKIKIGDTIAELNALFMPGKFHIFIDKSVIELYINDKYCMTKYLQANSQRSYNFALKISGKNAELSANIRCWNLRTIWKG